MKVSLRFHRLYRPPRPSPSSLSPTPRYCCCYCAAGAIFMIMSIIKNTLWLVLTRKRRKGSKALAATVTASPQSSSTLAHVLSLVLLIISFMLVIGIVITLIYASCMSSSSSTNVDVDEETNATSAFNQAEEENAIGKNSDSDDQSKSSEDADGPAASLVEDIFWSANIDRLLPPGFTPTDDAQWAGTFRSARVVRAEPGCGRMKNRLLTLSTGEKVCARYRKNNDQLQGEFFTFVLARLLGLRNVPPSLLTDYSRADGERWQAVANDLDAQAGWESRRPIVLTKFVANLRPAYIPASLRPSKGRRLDRDTLTNLTDVDDLQQVLELVQWSDLIVLDYLTANLDRIVNNMINERWNPQMMASPAHNLLRAGDNELLLFLDNESGLFHGYRLLAKYESFHRSMLDALCLFRRPTIDRLQKLASMNEAELTVHLHRSIRTAAALGSGSSSASSSSSSLLVFPHNNLVILRRRMRQILGQVDKCRAAVASTAATTTNIASS